MNILITGTSQGIGKAIACLFLEKGHRVIGIDRQTASITDGNYTHYVCDIRDTDSLPTVTGINVLINNAGTQNEHDIDINLKALISITERYGVQESIKSILNIGSASAHTGRASAAHTATRISSRRRRRERNMDSLLANVCLHCNRL